MFPHPLLTSKIEGDLDERMRKIALTTSLLGLLAVGIVTPLSNLRATATSVSLYEVGSYVLILSTVLVSAACRFHVRRVFEIGLLTLLTAFWIFTQFHLFRGPIAPTALAGAIFVPVLICLGLTHRMLIMLAPIQATLLYSYFLRYSAEYYADKLSPSAISAHAAMFAVCAAILFVLLGLVQAARRQTDARLMQTISEKEHLASTDPLTGLFNRRAYMRKLDGLCEELGGDSVICFLDLNNFKPLNDQYGHAAGDEVLRTVARRITACPNVVIAARLGGDEFSAVLQSRSSDEPIDQIVRELHASIISNTDIGGDSILIGVSIGYTDLPECKRDLSQSLNRADAALRRSKSKHGRVARFLEETDGQALETDRVRAAFPRAFAMGLIRPAIQPIVNARSLETTGYEMLARWTNCTLPTTPGPHEFIPIAEKLGLLNEVLWSMLDETLAHLSQTKSSLSINVSPGQLQSTDFIAQLLSILDHHGVSPNAISLEVTEQVAFRNVEENIEVLRAAREAGMQVALDDFGTGYSSLSMLDLLPIDKLKIDQSLVRQSERSGKDDAILRGAINLAAHLGLTCCVEGISSEQQAKRMARIGAAEIQGFWIGKPQLVSEQANQLKEAS